MTGRTGKRKCYSNAFGGEIEYESRNTILVYALALIKITLYAYIIEICFQNMLIYSNFY